MVVRQSRKVTDLAAARRKKAAAKTTSARRPATKKATTTRPARARKAVAKPPVEEPGLQPIPCTGCGTTVGYAATPHYRVFHAPWCAEYPAVDTKTEERDHRIVFLSVHKKVPTKTLADSFDLTRQRVQQILAKN